MLDLRLLGSLNLRRPDGGEVRSLLAQPKRVALLSYLALQGAGGYVRRDTLLALFWPEADSEHARGSLRRSLHFLRQSLGEGVLLTRGAEEVGVDPARLRCDALEFRRALERGALADALDLYRGELLEGFFISEVPEFDEWLESQRAELRERACGAAWALALEAEEAGAPERAAQLARRGVALSRYEEPAVRKLIALLARLGEREWALRTYEEFAERLLREYEAVPLEETRALVEALRVAAPSSISAWSPAPNSQTSLSPDPAGPHPGSAALDALDHTPGLATALPAVRLANPSDRPGEGLNPDGGTELFPLSPASTANAPDNGERGRGDEVLPEEYGSPRPAPLAAPPGTSARFPRAGWNRPRRGFLLLAIVAITIGAVIWRFGVDPPIPTSPTVVAVFPFAFHGSGEFGYLGEGIVNLLSTSLDGAGELRSVDPRALLSVVAQRGALDPQQGLTTAERFGAGLYVMGDIVEMGGRLQITAALYERRDGRGTLLSDATVSGAGDQLFALIAELATKLVAGQITNPGERLSRLAALTTHSLPALKAFLEGEANLRGGRYDAAMEAFQRAVEADTSFALAHYRLSSAATWINQDEYAKQAAQQALRFSDRLSLRDSRLVQAWHGYLFGAGDRAGSLYRAVLTSHPDDVEAWFQLGEVLFHWEPMLGRPPAEAREAFERVLSYEPDNVSALIHLARLAAREGEHARLDSLSGRILALEPEGDQALEMSALRAYTMGDAAAQRRTDEQLILMEDARLFGMVQTIAAHSYNLAGAAELARHLTRADRDPVQRARGYIMLAQLELAQGRWSAALRELQALERLRPGWGILLHAGFTLAPFHPAPPAELEMLRVALAGAEYAPWNPGAGPALHGAPQRAYRPRQLYLLGVLSARLGDPVAALQYAVELDRSAGPPLDAAYGRDLAPKVRAHVAWQGGHPADALAAFGDPHLPSDSMLPVLLSFPKADERWLRAEALSQLGQDEEALRWYATFPDPAGYDLIYLAPSHLRRAEIYERLGRRELALEHNRRFVELWQDADPELQPTVDAARRKLAQAGGKAAAK